LNAACICRVAAAAWGAAAVDSIAIAASHKWPQQLLGALMLLLLLLLHPSFWLLLWLLLLLQLLWKLLLLLRHQNLLGQGRPWL
jgi:hypothetical protein